MSPLELQVIDTWYINHRTNLKLIDQLTEEALSLTTSKRGGGTVGHQLAHIYNVRFWRLEKYDKTWVSGLHTIKAADEKTLDLLRKYHTTSADLIGQLIRNGLEQDGLVKGFSRGVVPLLGYFIHHEAHHRGNILLTLKLCGFKLPDELKYGIWEWNKI